MNSKMLKRFFPFMGWFEQYRFESLKADAVSGLTVALVLIPQSMAYAQLAGLPAYYGLYASFLPPLVASLFGSSRQLATGPVAVVSLLTAATIEPLARTGTPGYIAYAILLALIVGGFQFALGLFRLGIVINFLSHPVINGFTNAAAIIIASSQLSRLFGVIVDKADFHYETIYHVLKSAIHYTHWPTFTMGLFAFLIMYGLRRISPKIPSVLVAVVVTSAIAWVSGVHEIHVAEMDQMQSKLAKKRVMAFNQFVDETHILLGKRGKLQTEFERIDRNKDPYAALDLEHRIKRIGIHIDAVKEKIRGIRHELRHMLFLGVRGTDNTLLFVPKQELSTNNQEGKIWRIKVGNSSLDPGNLLFSSGLDVVGKIPQGLPSVSLAHIDFSTILRLFPYAVIISLLGFLEAISVAKAIAAKTGQHLDPNQELIGQGLANILGAATQSYPVSGSFSRSAVNLQSGAVSGLSGIFTSITVGIVLLFFTPLLFYLPQSVLAAIIIMAVIDLINISGFIHAMRAKWFDGAISIITFACTLVFAPHLDRGILVGVVLSLAVFLYKSMRPQVASLSLYEDEALHDSVTYCLSECRLMEVIRFDGPLFFANASYLEDQIDAHLLTKKELKHIIVLANSINDMDATGEETLSLIIDRIRSAGLDISFCGINRSVMAVLKRTHLLAKIGEDHLYPTIDKALKEVHKKTHSDAEEEICPLTTVCHLPEDNS